MKKMDFSKYKKDYRHVICSAITLLSLAAGVLFPNSLVRILETLRDVATSFVFYLFEFAMVPNNPILPTVAQPQSWKMASEVWRPVKFLPATWEEFCLFWEVYLDLLFDADNFEMYWEGVCNFLIYGSRFLAIFLPVVLIVIVKLNGYKDKQCTVRGKKSLHLIKFEQFIFRKIYPVIAWLKDFKTFLQENEEYKKAWLVLWCLHFNVFSIVIALVAYYFYLVASLDLLSIYTQLLKLQTDLTPMIRFIPGIAWFVIFLIIYNRVCRSMAFNRLYANEEANRAVLKQSSIITSVYGEPGLGKTKLITSMALSGMVQMFDDAFKIMITRASQFPNFPWQTFRDEVKKLVDNRVIVDIKQAKNYFSSHRKDYDYIVEQYKCVEWRRYVRKHNLKDPTYGYDYEHYRSDYNNELKIVHLYEALESYAAAFLVFSAVTNLLFSNYSIRVDSIIHDIGNLPLRDNDFFNRDPRYQEAYSQHSHIIDFDVLRLGKKIVENNKKANGAPFGVIVVSEIDKEFKNSMQLKETKIKTEETNQKNDLHDACLMMIRHGVVIDFISFVRVIADLQRPEAWGAGGRELGNVVFISEKTDMEPCLPFMSPYWLFQGLFSVIQKKWDDYYSQYCYNRSDETLFVYVCKNIITAIANHYERINGLFGVEILHLEIQSGRMDGTVRKDKWRIMAKKDFSNRYRTDCLESVFDKYEPNTMYIDDFVMYAGELATREECAEQHSYFQMDVHQMRS